MSASYPAPAMGFPTARPRSAAADTAQTMVLLALILQVIGGAILFVALAAIFGYSVLHPFAYAGVAVLALASVVVVVGLFLYLAYSLSYERIRRGDYVGAQTPTLVLGILSLFAGLLPGVFYLIGYVKLGDAIREQGAPVPFYGAPGASGASGLVACRGCGRVFSAGSVAFCPGCGQKLGA
jgi:hypothetical protein